MRRISAWSFLRGCRHGHELGLKLRQKLVKRVMTGLSRIETDYNFVIVDIGDLLVQQPGKVERRSQMFRLNTLLNVDQHAAPYSRDQGFSFIDASF